MSNEELEFCATETDEDYNAVKVGWCNENCHVQVSKVYKQMLTSSFPDLQHFYKSQCVVLFLSVAPT